MVAACPASSVTGSAAMRAAVLESFAGPLRVMTVDVPPLGADAALIQVAACGICRSDWHGWMGHDSEIRLPHVPGHELAGVVAEVGADVRSFLPGARVTVPFSCGCGTCEQCTSGNSQICDHYTQPGFTHWGAFAEFVEIRHADVNLVPLPESIDFVSAASLGCRFATSFRGIVHQAGVKADDTVTVHGCGGVGLSAVMIAAARGARVVAIDIHDPQLQKARDCGADVVLNAAEIDDVGAAIKDLTNGGASVSVDALGSRQTCYQSIAGLRKRGRHVQIGLTLGDDADPAIPMSAVIAGELRILGSHGMPTAAYPEMLSMIESGRLNPRQLVGECVSLETACERLPRLNEFSSAGAIIIDRF